MTEPSGSRKPSGAEPHAGNRNVDPVTGYDTTGHDWGGITELNTPFPRLVIWILAATFVYSVAAWVLLPAWPVGRDYTRGLLGLDQGVEAVEGFRALSAERQGWLDRFATGDFAALRSDTALLGQAMPAAKRLFADSCAACHGTSGQGGPGFPVLADHYWLWSGDPGEIALTIRNGINTNDDSRIAEMPSFDWMDRADRRTLAEYVAALPTGETDAGDSAAALFAENCAACHGEGGEGGLGIGAPSLTDAAIIYGQDAETVFQTITQGRIGVMPAWAGRLSQAEVNLLTIYVALLATAGGRGVE